MGLFFGFRGRINRGKYWLVLLLWFVIWIAAIVAAVIGIDTRSFDGAVNGDEIFAMLAKYLGWFVLFALLFLISWISGLAIAVKRLHDRDKSGWWVLLFYFVPSILSALQANMETQSAALVLGLASFAITVWAFVELGCLRGTPGPTALDPIRSQGFPRRCSRSAA